MPLPTGLQTARIRRRLQPILLSALIVCSIYYFFFSLPPQPEKSKVGVYDEYPSGQKPAGAAEVKRPPPTEVKNDLVVASLKGDNTAWLYEYFPSWHKSIYVVNDPDAALTVKQNKGRESMVYLTYIIDNYDRLPEHILFVHSGRFQWHNDDPYYDGVPMLRRLQLPYIDQEGYVNLRCTWTLGCPAEIRPHTDEHRDDVHAGEYFKTGFEQLFPGVPVPEEVGVSCCAQFAVTKWKILERPKSDYVRYRSWLMATDLPDDLSGRIMEYSWHMIFGKQAIHCPSPVECYCNVFGLCGLKCDTADCEGRYTLPPYSTLPEGWPHIGWSGEEVDLSGNVLYA